MGWYKQPGRRGHLQAGKLGARLIEHVVLAAKLGDPLAPLILNRDLRPSTAHGRSEKQHSYQLLTVLICCRSAVNLVSYRQQLLQLAEFGGLLKCGYRG